MSEEQDGRQVLYVHDSEQLLSLCATLKDSEWLAVDTEFLREKTYYPKLCLLQIANTSVIACVDPLTVKDLTPLFDILYDTSIVKILHSARQDYEIFFYMRGALPQPVFDTQVAASICTGDAQISYAGLVEQVTGVTLEKGCTRTDWSKRPLSAGQLKYAQDDVRYLGAIFQHQTRVLKEKGLSSWLVDECASLVDPQTYQVETDKMWLRIKECRRLRPGQLVVLKALAAWREDLAVARDKPRRWVVRDEVLVELAKKQPTSEVELHDLKGLSDSLVERNGAQILSIISDAKQTPQEQWPSFPKRIKRSTEEEAMIDVMMALIRKCATEYGVAAPVLGGRKDVDALMNNDEACRLLHGWRYDVVGKILQDFMHGEVKVTVVDDHLEIEHT